MKKTEQSEAPVSWSESTLANDPPLRAVRRVVPPLRVGGIAIDLAFLIVMIGLGALMQLALLL